LGIGSEAGVGTQICRDLLRLVLKDQGPRSLDGMVVRQRQIDGLIKSNDRRILPDDYTSQQQEGRGEDAAAL
jgi:hypothetical protein